MGIVVQKSKVWPYAKRPWEMTKDELPEKYRKILDDPDFQKSSELLRKNIAEEEINPIIVPDLPDEELEQLMEQEDELIRGLLKEIEPEF